VRCSVTERSGSASELVKSALQLLQSLPATRSAVLQYITDIYDDAVNQHLEQREWAYGTACLLNICLSWFLAGYFLFLTFIVYDARNAFTGKFAKCDI